MKVKKEIKNGIYIFISIGTYFLLMEFLGLSNNFYLRLVNVIFIVYAVNDTLRSRIAEGKNKFLSNIVAAFITATVGIVLSIGALLAYSYTMGGEAYIKNLSESFLFGGHPSINLYCFSLFFEAMSSALIIILLLILYYNNKFESD